MVTQAQESIRIATFHTGLKRQGPGLLLRDIVKGDSADIVAARDIVAAVYPDIILFTRFDFDVGLQALSAFAEMLRDAGADYPFMFAFAPNSGVATGLDMDGNGYFGDARDAQGYGSFAGQGGMALLSRFPIDTENARDFSGFLWRDLPNARLPDWPESLLSTQRLSSVGHWDVPVLLTDGTVLHLLAYHASTPVFDGPKSRNRLRNADETLFWQRYLDGELAFTPPSEPFIILGDANQDPMDGDGDQFAIRSLLSDSRLQDPQPKSEGAREASDKQGGINLTQLGDANVDTADLRENNGPGNLRLDYVLPSAGIKVTDAGVFWPASDDPNSGLLSGRDSSASWHGLVWVDIVW